MKKHAVKLSPLALAMATALPVASVSTSASAELSGNIGVFSKYVLRGMTNDAESDTTAIQGGIDYGHESGFYLGWWASSLDYTHDPDGSGTSGNGFENDFYGGFASELENGLGWDVGLIQYYYLDVEDSDLTEAVAGVSYGPFSAGFQYLLSDGVWGNDGDIYWKLGYSTDLPKGFGFAIDLGYYTYDDDDVGNNEKGWTTTTSDSELRHVNLTLSHPIGNTGADMAVTYVIGGKDRTETDQEDTMVLSLTYGFDITD